MLTNWICVCVSVSNLNIYTCLTTKWQSLDTKMRKYEKCILTRHSDTFVWSNLFTITQRGSISVSSNYRPLVSLCLRVPVIKTKWGQIEKDSHPFWIQGSKVLVKLAHYFTLNPIIITRKWSKPKTEQCFYWNRQRWLSFFEKHGFWVFSFEHCTVSKNSQALY